MSIAESLLAEFEAQAPITREYLKRLPEDKLTWKPHEKSMTAGQLALHLATTPGGVARGAQSESMAPPNFGHYPQPASRDEVLKAFEESVATVKSVLPGMDDAMMHGTWRLVVDGKEMMAMPREQFLRNIMFSHWYQHRGQFSVYLRLLGAPVPASWGPSADEAPVFTRAKETVAA